MHNTGFEKAQLFLLFDRASATNSATNSATLEANDSGSWLPTDTQLTQWLYPTLLEALPDAWREHNIEVSLSCVNNDEIRALNLSYRNKDRSTNVLSFPADMPVVPALQASSRNSSRGTVVLGDVVVCPEVLAVEAHEQKKTLEHHWAHMLVHSVLHLLGLDHQDENTAHAMESQEIRILSKLGITNPYLTVSAKQS